jgi:integrase
MSKKLRIPGYRKHSSGQARLTLDGKDHLLGPFGSAESEETYRRLVREWLDGKNKPTTEAATTAEPLTVAALVLAYWKHAKAYYGLSKARGDYHCLRHALRVVRSLYGRTPTAEFGPKRLKACRQEMIGKDWSRTYANAQIDRVRRMFRFAVEEELFPTAGSVYESLKAVAGLRRGKTDARETERVKPVAAAHVEATLPFLPPHVKAMVELQLLTGCWPAEVCLFRPADIDRTDPACWVFRPEHHKTEHHGYDRLVFIGPKAQEVLKQFLDGAADAYCFSPRGSERHRARLRQLKRKSPLTPSQRARQPKARRRRAPKGRYDVAAYRRAITRACAKADAAARTEALKTDPSIPADKVFVPPWSPNRLRHARATELRRVAGLDVTKTVLGHSKVETTQIYAEKDLKAAMELVGKIG